MSFRTRRATLKALQDPDVLTLLNDVRRIDPRVDRLYDEVGLNVSAPTGLQKLRYLLGFDLSGRK